MANITAAMVKELREATSAGMMDCKNALNEVGGDIDAAIDWLRKKGLSKAAKKAGRVAAEGLVAVEFLGPHGRDPRSELRDRLRCAQRPVPGLRPRSRQDRPHGRRHGESLAAAHFPGSQTTVKDRLQELIATIGENMSLRRVAKLEVSKGVIASYVHNAVTEGLGKIGVLVALESEGDVTALSTLGRQIAMHVAATNPMAVDASGVDPAVLERESAILRDKNAGKPENVMQKIIESGLKSYYKEVTLLEQSFVHDPSKTVAQVLKEAESKAGKPVVLKSFVRYALGEGIEKEEAPDFAAEVAAAAGQKA